MLTAQQAASPPPSQERRPSPLLHAGWLAAAVFLATLLGCAALDGGYSHQRHSVSLLGSATASAPLVFNVGGFLVPGLLLVAFAVAVGRELAAQRSTLGARLAVNLMIIAGIAFAAAGVWPYAPGRDDAAAQRHVVALGVAMISALPAMAVAAAALRPRAGWRPLPQAGTALAAALLLSLVLPADRWMPGWTALPGYSQRLTLLLFFAWPALASVVALRRRGDRATRPPALSGAEDRRHRR